MDGVNSVMYYEIKPMADQNSTYYIPVASANDKLRLPLAKEQVLELIDTMPKSADETALWTENRRERKELYAQILRGDDQKALVQLISSLYFRKQDQEAQGKRFSAMDETMMKNAESLMLQEFGVVLGMEPQEVRAFIENRIHG